MIGTDIPQKKTLTRVAPFGLNPKVIFDVGSSHCLWSHDIVNVSPHARLFLFEPLIDHRSHYKAWCERMLRRRRNFELIASAVADQEGTLEIWADRDGYGSSISRRLCLLRLTNSQARPPASKKPTGLKPRRLSKTIRATELLFNFRKSNLLHLFITRVMHSLKMRVFRCR